MHGSRGQLSCRSRYLVNALLLLTLFFLPLHVHFPAHDSQLSQECSCCCGGRPQLGLAPVLTNLIAIYEVALLVPAGAPAPRRGVTRSESARAPPYSPIA
jgi:hypothetical protein